MTARLTEAEVTRLLREKHTKSGNGGAGEYAFLAQVRNDAGFGANRTFDAVAMNLWPSRGMSIEVFEIKVSRSDWQRELAKPDKAEDACKFADQFTIVAPAGCVKDGELPPTWGLIEVFGDGTDDKPWRLRTKKTAPWIGLPTNDPGRKVLPRGLVVGMLRAAPGAVPGGKVPSASDKELAVARAEGHAAAAEQFERQRERDLRTGRDVAEQVKRMREALMEAGVPYHEAALDSIASNAKLYADAIAGRRLDRQLDGVRTTLRRALEELDMALLNQEATRGR